jgi:hypothetical protein
MRRIEMAWWIPRRVVRIYLGNDISLHDLWTEEVTALVDQLEFKHADPDYKPPTPSIGPMIPAWFQNHHPNRPGHTLWASYGENGDDSWSIMHFGVSWEVTGEEVQMIVERFRHLLALPEGRLCTDITMEQDWDERADWITQGF